MAREGDVSGIFRCPLMPPIKYLLARVLKKKVGGNVECLKAYRLIPLTTPPPPAIRQYMYL
jgi:hypothetical protein